MPDRLIIHNNAPESGKSVRRVMIRGHLVMARGEERREERCQTFVPVFDVLNGLEMEVG